MLSSAREAKASIVSRFNVRDDAYAPLIEAGRAQRTTYFRKTEAEYFFRGGLTRLRITRSDLPDESGQERGLFLDLMYDSVHDESQIQDR
jgi:hypothetical protein